MALAVPATRGRVPATRAFPWGAAPTREKRLRRERSEEGLLPLGSLSWRGHLEQMSMPMAPYAGQGMQLGRNAGYSGDWIIGGRYFLCPGVGDDTPALRGSNGQIAIGFSTDRIAALFGISTNELMAANRRKELSIQEISDAQITGSTTIRLFGFSLQNKIVTVTVEDLG
jgi:hypothetical protein